MSSTECFTDKMKIRHQAPVGKTSFCVGKEKSRKNRKPFNPDIDSQALTVHKVAAYFSATPKEIARWPGDEQQLKSVVEKNSQTVEHDVTSSGDVAQPLRLRHRIISVKPLTTEPDLTADDCLVEDVDDDGTHLSLGETGLEHRPVDSNTGIKALDCPVSEMPSDLKVIDIESETFSLQSSISDGGGGKGQVGSDVISYDAVPESSAKGPRQAFENPDDLKTEANDEKASVVSYFVNDAVTTITTTTTTTEDEGESAVATSNEEENLAAETEQMGHSRSTSSSIDWNEVAEAAAAAAPGGLSARAEEAAITPDGDETHGSVADPDCDVNPRPEQEVKTSSDQDERELGARIRNAGNANDENSSNCNEVILDEYLSKKFLLHSPAPPRTRILFQIMRDRVGLNRKYYALLELNGEKIFYMAGRKRIKTRSSNYVISIDRDQIKRGSDFYVGKLKSNIVGTKFTLYNTIVHLDNDSGKTAWSSSRSMLWSKYAPKEELAAVIYAPNPLGFYGPRKMTVILPDIDDISNTRIMIKPKRTEDSLLSRFKAKKTDNLLILHSKPPIWEQAKNSYVLNFFGRVTQPSVKNFQLIDPNDPTDIIMQFGRVGSNVFTMDYKRPLSAVQAFGIALSCFDCKLACE